MSGEEQTNVGTATIAANGRVDRNVGRQILEMIMEDKEAIYDEQIAPLMTQLLEICQREGVPMFASFQYSEVGFCTSALSTGHCVFEHYRALAQCALPGGVNVDKYMDWVAKDARKNGHCSIYLKMSGIPEVPPNR